MMSGSIAIARAIATADAHQEGHLADGQLDPPGQYFTVDP